jgi:hypothetical protein
MRAALGDEAAEIATMVPDRRNSPPRRLWTVAGLAETPQGVMERLLPRFSDDYFVNST